MGTSGSVGSDARPTTLRPRVLVAGVRDRARRSDLMLTAAALTCYAVLGLVPLLAIAVRVDAGLLGRSEVIATARDVAAYVPGPLGVDRALVALATGASATSWWLVLVALVPVSLYSEGTVRALERFSVARERRSRTLRGRLLTAPLVAVVVGAATLVVVVLRPALAHGVGTGTGARLLGVFLAFCVLWAGATALLCLVYRAFATTAIRPGPLVLAAAAAGSWLAGQTLGYVAALRVVGGFAHAYGGQTTAGAVAALAFFVYLDHIAVLLGYVTALYLHECGIRVGPAGTRRDVAVGR